MKNRPKRNILRNREFAMEEKPVPVIFRIWHEQYQDRIGGLENDSDNVIALFPTIPGNNNPITCQSYMRKWQHAVTDYVGVINGTKAATPTQYQKLKAELERIGYDVQVCLKATPAMHKERST